MLSLVNFHVTARCLQPNFTICLKHNCIDSKDTCTTEWLDSKKVAYVQILSPQTICYFIGSSGRLKPPCLFMYCLQQSKNNHARMQPSVWLSHSSKQCCLPTSSGRSIHSKLWNWSEGHVHTDSRASITLHTYLYLLLLLIFALLRSFPSTFFPFVETNPPNPIFCRSVSSSTSSTSSTKTKTV